MTIRTASLPTWHIPCAGVLCLLGHVTVSFAQGTNIPSDEVERRNAAVGFIQVQDATLQILRVECGYLMPDQSSRVDGIARAWFERNKDDLTSANVWVSQYLAQAKSVSNEAFQQASNALSGALSEGMQANIKMYFNRMPPTAETCTKALAPYATPQMDVQSIGLNPGFERFAEFGKTLKSFREQPGYAVPPSINTKYREKVTMLPAASLAAALAARERGDGASMRSIYEKLAAYGEAQSAQSLGIAYFNGDLSPKDMIQAYRWFYTAWSLGDFQGLNAMGVMLRDGRGVPTNVRLAYGAFQMATQGAQSKGAQEMASRNVESLQTKLTDDDKKVIACMSLESFDAELKKPVETQSFPRLKGIQQGQRKLGQILRAFGQINLAECP